MKQQLENNPTGTDWSSLADTSEGHKMSVSGNILECVPSPTVNISFLLWFHQGRVVADSPHHPPKNKKSPKKHDTKGCCISPSSDHSLSGCCYQCQPCQPAGRGSKSAPTNPNPSRLPCPPSQGRPALPCPILEWMGICGSFKNSSKAAYLKFFWSCFDLGYFLKLPFSIVWRS